MHTGSLSQAFLALTLAACGTASGTGSDAAAAASYGPAHCPQEWGGPTRAWRPHATLGDVDDSSALAAEDPTGGLICAYLSDNTQSPRGKALTGTWVVGGDQLTALADALHHAPPLPPGDRFCTLIGGPEMLYLVALDYASGRLWIATSLEPNRSTAATNGSFASDEDMTEPIVAVTDESLGWLRRAPCRSQGSSY